MRGLEELYVTPPDRFVAARNELAKTLPEAKALRRPSASAWLLNVLATESGRSLDALFHAGDALRKAQQRVLGGDDPETMHAATRAVRDALGKALEEARKQLAKHHRREDPALLKKVSSILRSASVDLHVREAVRSGKLLADPQEDEDAFLGDLASQQRRKVHVAPKKKPKVDAKAALRAQREEAERAKRAQLEAALASAREVESRAEREKSAADREVEGAEAALEEARERAAEAKRALDTARRKRAHAEKAL
jgi:hypothetical protein